MFIGHYAASFALKSVSEKTSLGVLFIAVQLVEILFFGLTLAGVEKFNLVENYTDSTHFQLTFMPYSHSLAAAVFWALLVLLLYKIFSKAKSPATTKTAQVIALAVLSHWLLDLIVHTPDLPLLTDDSLKVGLGLWHNAILTYLVEAAFLLAGLALYMRSTHGATRSARVAMPLFVCLLLLLNIANIFGPLGPDDNTTSMAISALAAYAVFALIALVLDKKRRSR